MPPPAATADGPGRTAAAQDAAMNGDLAGQRIVDVQCASVDGRAAGVSVRAAEGQRAGADLGQAAAAAESPK